MSIHAELPQRRRSAGGVAALGVLALTTILSLLWSHVRLMWNDEFLSLYSDSTATLRDVFDVQLHSPISLDPPTYHLLSHLSIDLFGQTATALRLPALAGFLLLEASLFLLARRLAGDRAALIAMTLPLVTASFRYAVEGRPYGLLLGLYALSLLCWYVAAANAGRQARTLPLVGLAAALALAITSHYFGVLILVPVSVGEFARTVKRRQFDWPLLGALATGAASVALILPFQKALLPYRRHYYTGTVNLHNVSQGYRELFLRYGGFAIAVQHVVACLLLMATLGLIVAAVRLFRGGPILGDSPDLSLWAGLWAALLTLAALPLLGYLFGKFVTHTMEVRYVIAALIAFALTFALVLGERLRSDHFFYVLFPAMLLLATVAATTQIVADRRKSDALLATLTVPPALTAELAAHPADRLYTQSLTDLFTDSYYAPTPLVRERITLLYDESKEVQWLGHNTNAVTAVYLHRFSPLATAPYAQLLAQPAPLLLDYNTGWEWVGKDLAARPVPEEVLGMALGGRLVRLHVAHRAGSLQ